VREAMSATNEGIEEEDEREGRSKGKGRKLVDVEAVLRGGVHVREMVYPRGHRGKRSSWVGSGSAIASGGVW